VYDLDWFSRSVEVLNLSLEKIRFKEAIEHRKNGHFCRHFWGNITYLELLTEERQYHKIESNEIYPPFVLTDQSDAVLCTAWTETYISGEIYGWN